MALVLLASPYSVPVQVGANPSASVGLTTVNGSSQAYMRADAAPALSQAIVPTWTGTHTWSTAGAAIDVVSAFAGAGFPVRVRNSGDYNLYLQGTNANRQVAFYLENDRGTAATFTSYGGFFYGGSTTIFGSWMGRPRADRLFMFADGTSNLGMVVGTASNAPLDIATNGLLRLTVTGSGDVGMGTDTPGARTHTRTLDAVTAALTTVEITEHQSSGTPAANFGVQSLWRLHSSTTTGRNAAAINVLWDTATDASRAPAVNFVAMDNAATRTAISYGANGTAATLSFYGAAKVPQQTGVAVSAAGIHAALVNLGLITA